MRNPKHLARLYDALRRGDEEEEDNWRVDANGSGARALDSTVNEDGGAVLFDGRGTLPPRGNHNVIQTRAGAGHKRHHPCAANVAARGFKETYSEGAIV